MSLKNETWEILEQLKRQFGYNSDSELADNFGVSLAALRKWRSRDKIPNKIDLKISDLRALKGNGGSFNQIGDGNNSNLNVGDGANQNINSNLNSENAEVGEVIELLSRGYYTPNMLAEIKQKLLKIKEIMEN